MSELGAVHVNVALDTPLDVARRASGMADRGGLLQAWVHPRGRPLDVITMIHVTQLALESLDNWLPASALNWTARHSHRRGRLVNDSAYACSLSSGRNRLAECRGSESTRRKFAESTGVQKLTVGSYKLFLLIVFIAVWVWAAVKPMYREDWLLENYLVFIFVPVIIVSARYFRLSNISYTLITLFMSLHVVGSHYTYAEVPLGFELQEWMGAGRNMYDRFVHFAFGLLLAYPMREVFMRVARTKGFWGYFIPLTVVMACSAAYEIIEWLVAERVDVAAGLAFLGAQGDIWDAQKDTLVAVVGACIALLIVAGINWRYDPNFWIDMRLSFRIPHGDRPLGEVRLRDMIDAYWKGKGRQRKRR